MNETLEVAKVVGAVVLPGVGMLLTYVLGGMRRERKQTNQFIRKESTQADKLLRAGIITNKEYIAGVDARVTRLEEMKAEEAEWRGGVTAKLENIAGTLAKLNGKKNV